MKAIILARVSSKEQEEGHSLTAQVARLTEYANRKGLEIIRVFEIIESSTHGNRKKFKEALDYCKKQKEKIAVIADAVDRVQRSFNDSILLNDLMQKGIIELHFWRENMTLGKNASSTDIMRWDFSVMAAKSYILQLSENVKRSINYKITHGEFIRQAPIGYKNYRDEMNKSQIMPDPILAPKIVKLFEAYAMGGCSFKELAVYAKELGVLTRTGKPVKPNFLHHTLQNPFYYGEMLINGKLYPHKYKPIISKELYDRCQGVRTSANKTPWKYCEKEYLYRGLIRCANSGKICSEYTVKGHNYITYYDKDGHRKQIREEEMTNTVYDILKSIRIPKELTEIMVEELKKMKKGEVQFRKNEVMSLKRELELTESRIDSLLNLLLDGKIDNEIFQTKMPDLKCKQQQLKNKIEAHQKADESFNDTVRALFSLTNHMADYFARSSNISLARTILKAVVLTLEIKDGNIGYSLRFPFSELQNLDENSKWRPLLYRVLTGSQEEIKLAVSSVNDALTRWAA